MNGWFWWCNRQYILATWNEMNHQPTRFPAEKLPKLGAKVVWSRYNLTRFINTQNSYECYSQMVVEKKYESDRCKLWRGTCLYMFWKYQLQFSLLHVSYDRTLRWCFLGRCNFPWLFSQLATTNKNSLLETPEVTTKASQIWDPVIQRFKKNTEIPGPRFLHTSPGPKRPAGNKKSAKVQFLAPQFLGRK